MGEILKFYIPQNWLLGGYNFMSLTQVDLGNHYHIQCTEQFCHAGEKIVLLPVYSQTLLPPLTAIGLFSVYTCRFAFSRIPYKCNSIVCNFCRWAAFSLVAAVRLISCFLSLINSFVLLSSSPLCGHNNCLSAWEYDLG